MRHQDLLRYRELNAINPAAQRQPCPSSTEDEAEKAPPIAQIRALTSLPLKHSERLWTKGRLCIALQPAAEWFRRGLQRLKAAVEDMAEQLQQPAQPELILHWAQEVSPLPGPKDIVCSAQPVWQH
jgi:hypothetical protein